VSSARWARGSRRDEDPPQGAEDQERPERDVRPPADPARDEQHAEHEPGGEQPGQDPADRPRQPEHQPDPDQQLHVAHPEGALPERDREQVQRGRQDHGDQEGQQQRAADERVVPGEVEDDRNRDDRERQLVREKPLIQVDREPGDQTREPEAEDDLGDDRDVGGAEPERQERERERPDRGRRDRPPADRPPGDELLVVLRPADCDPIGDDAEDRPGEREREDEWVQALAPASASSTSVAWVTPLAPRGAYGSVFRK
jgi:hypothetical protein